MTSTVYRERSQDSVIVLSDSDGEKEEKCLKIHYQESLEFFEIPMESDGRISLEDVISMDPKIFALIVQKDGYRKLVKPKNGYWKEPKEKWKNFKVFAALKRQSEVIELNGNSFNQNFNPNTNAAFNWNTKIKSDNPAMLAGVPQNNVVSDHASSHASTSLDNINNRTIRAEASTILAPLQQNIIKAHHPSTLYSAPNNSLTEGFAQVLTPINKCAHDEILSCEDEYLNCIKPVEEPAIDQLFFAYKVSNLDELKYVLCRGFGEYINTSNIYIRRFKRTLAAYPNNETIRLFYRAKISNILMKDLDSTVKEYCKLCKEALTLKHLLSGIHAKNFHEKYNADPPEIAKLLEPEIYKQFIDPTVLTSMNIPGFKKMEESPEFSINDSPEKTELMKLKYILIRRILQANLRLSYIKTFCVEKLLFVRKNFDHHYLSKSFTINEFHCEGCKRFSESFHNFLQHIFSVQHLRDCLNQEELNGICKAMSYMEQTSGGFRFLPLPNYNRKRRQTSNSFQSGKRHKNS